MATNGHSQSASALEREAEESRAQVEATLEELRFRMSPGQVVDQVVDYARESGGAEFLRNLGTQAVANPVPVVLMAAGMAWLMMGPRRATQSQNTSPFGGDFDRAGRLGEDAVRHVAQDARATSTSGSHRGSSAAGSARGAAANVAGTISDAASRGSSYAADAASGARAAMHRFGDHISSISDGASDTMSNIGSRAGNTASAVRDRVSSMADTAWDAGQHLADGSSVGRVFRDQPLLVGAIGVAIGAAIAAALPQTQIEREYVGPTSDAFKEQAQRAVQEHYGQMKEAATNAMGAARQEVDRQFDSANDSVRNVGERLTGAADRAMGAMEKGVDRAKSELAANDKGGEKSGQSGGQSGQSGAQSAQSGRQTGGQSGQSGGQKSAAANSPAMGGGSGSGSGPQSIGGLPGNSSTPSRSS